MALGAACADAETDWKLIFARMSPKTLSRHDASQSKYNTTIHVCYIDSNERMYVCVCMYVYGHMYMCLCMYLCVCIYMCVCVCVCIYVCVVKIIFKNTQKSVNTMCEHTYMCIH